MSAFYAGAVTDRAPEAIETVLPRAIGALEALAELGESIEDEWQYVSDLLRIHTADLRALAAADSRLVTGAAVDAIDLLADEAGRISDPHRAIDWLSTLPQAVRLALSLRVGAA
jgi:hypothetical protein